MVPALLAATVHLSWPHHREVVYPLRKGIRLLVSMCTAATQLCRIYMSPCINTIRGAPIGPIRVVVVHVAARVDIPRVVRVAAIRRP